MNIIFIIIAAILVFVVLFSFLVNIHQQKELIEEHEELLEEKLTKMKILIRDLENKIDGND